MKPFFSISIVMAMVLQLAGRAAGPAEADDHLWIVSPSTSLPFTKAVAERVAKAAGSQRPVVEHADTALGLKLLCNAKSSERPDAVAASRRITKAEHDACRENGVAEIVEIPVGLDLLVLAQAKAGPVLELTAAQVFLALARQAPDEYGEMALNAYKRWSEVDASLPDLRIDVRTLQRFSGTRETLQDLILRKGAQSIPRIAGIWGKTRALPRSVIVMREDHPFIIMHESEEVIARELVAHPTAVGVFGYRFLQAYAAGLRGIPIDGAAPTPENAYAGKYPGTRVLYLYFRKADVGRVAGLDRLGAEYLSGEALGPDGYLLKLGFVPLALDDMMKSIVLAKALPPVSREALPE